MTTNYSINGTELTLNNFDPNNNCTLHFYVLVEIVVSFPALVMHRFVGILLLVASM